MSHTLRATASAASREKRRASAHVDTTGLAVRASLRAQVLAAIGVNTALLQRTVETQAHALDATVKGSDDPNWDARLRAAEAIQGLGIPKPEHGNAPRSGTLLVEFPDWFKQLAERRAPKALGDARPSGHE